MDGAILENGKDAKGREKSEQGLEDLSLVTYTSPAFSISNITSSAVSSHLAPNSPCVTPQSQQQSYPKLGTPWACCGAPDQPCTSWRTGQGQGSLPPLRTRDGCWARQKRELPLLEVCVEYPVGESLTADADAFKDTITPQLVQHQEGIHGSCG